MFNDKAVADTTVGKEIEMYVAIHFAHAGVCHILTRSVTALKGADSSLSSLSGKYRLNQIHGGKETDLAEELAIVNYINSILNVSVKNYFFFDGARIETFTKISL